MTKGGAEFYPSCTQVRVGGSSSGTATDTVTFPGGYSDSDPGIFDPNVFDSDDNYVFPGPPVSNLAATSAGITPPATASATFPAEGASATGGSGSGSATSATHVASPSASAGTSAGVATSGSQSQCRLKKNSTSNLSVRDMPRHYSRIMARIMHSS